MDDADTTRTLDDLLEPGATLMVGVGDPVTDTRPLTVASVDGRRVDILVDTREQWAAELTDGDAVLATLSDNRANVWASLYGTGSLSRDPARVDELWSPFASAYFEDGRDTPGIGVFSFDVAEGRWWSSPGGRLGSLVSLVRAAVGTAEAAGDQGEVRLSR